MEEFGVRVTGAVFSPLFDKKFEAVIVLLPCYSLEDFSLYRNSEESNQIFSAWSALYHPALIDFIGGMPQWERAGNPMKDRKWRLIVIPPCCESQIPRDWLQAMEESDALIIRNRENRDEIVADALEGLKIDPTPFSEDDVQSFLSLGFCHFASELLSRKLRYMSNLDADSFGRKTIAAVTSFRKGNREEANDHLRRAFELLTESKEYFFPMAMKFIDLTWLSRDSLGEPLRRALLKRRHRNESTNLILPAFYLDKIKRVEPETLALLREEIAAKRLMIAGSDEMESPLYLLPQTEIAANLLNGLLDYRRILGVRPFYFARNSAGFSPVLPQLLALLGFEGAVFFTRDGWRPNKDDQSRLEWRGPNKTRIPALARNPLDGEIDKVFMELADRVGYSTGSDLVSAAVFDHRPDRERPWLGDMARMARFAPVLGAVTTLGEFFHDSQGAGAKKEFGYDLFRTNFLTRAAKEDRPDPVSGWRQFYAVRSRMAALTAMTLFAGVYQRKRPVETRPGFAQLAEKSESLAELKEEVARLLFYPTSLAIDFDDIGGEKGEEDRRSKTREEIRGEREKQVERIACLADCCRQSAGDLEMDFARFLHETFQPNDTAKKKAREKKAEEKTSAVFDPLTATSVFLVNPASVGQSTSLEGNWPIPSEAAASVLGRYSEEKSTTRITLPPFSAVRLERADGAVGEESARNKTESPKSTENKKQRGGFFRRLANRFGGGKREITATASNERTIEFREERYSDGQFDRFYLLRNRFFEIKIDAATGRTLAIRTFTGPSINPSGGLLRQPAIGNRMSWQVAYRLSASERLEDARPSESSGYGYSIMAAEKIAPLPKQESSERRSESAEGLEIRGSLVLPGGTIASKWSETILIRPDSRVIEVRLGFEPVLLPEEGPWENYYGVRFAWNDKLAEIRPMVHGAFWETDRDYFQAPEALDLRSEENIGLTILSGGLPFYHREGLTRLDSILIPKGESGRSFRFGIGVDLENPLEEAIRFLSPEPIRLDGAGEMKRPFHRLVDVAGDSVSVVALEPIDDSPEKIESNANSSADRGRSVPMAGFRLILQETAGKKTTVRVRTELPMAAVFSTDFLRRVAEKIEMEDKKTFRLELKSHQILPLEILLL